MPVYHGLSWAEVVPAKLCPTLRSVSKSPTIDQGHQRNNTAQDGTLGWHARHAGMMIMVSMVSSISLLSLRAVLFLRCCLVVVGKKIGAAMAWS
jgi:hypothetical protein